MREWRGGPLPRLQGSYTACEFSRVERSPKPPGSGDRVLVRRNETFPPVTIGHIRGHGCRDLLIYCGSINCNHSATMNGDWLAEDVHVRSLCQRMVCTKCGMIVSGLVAPLSLGAR